MSKNKDIIIKELDLKVAKQGEIILNKNFG